MARRQSRRQFVKSTAALGMGYWVAGGIAPKRSLAANEEIRFACIGVGGKGSDDSNNVSRLGKVVGICDIDDEFLNKAKEKFPEARAFNDFRKLFDEMADSIDAVTVSTPDHTHAVAALTAMRLGKHCYCQKPMTHSIEEARLMAETAAETGVVTQMGNQGTALDTLRKSAALIKAGCVGKVSEVHVWTNRPVWPQGVGTQPKIEPVPAGVHWDLWIGPSAKHGFSREIHPFKWRGYWNYGTGALGDMACHTLNMSYMALDLNNPVSVSAKSGEHDKYVYPGSSVIEYEFAANDWRPALKLFWYDGGERPLSLLKGCPKNPNDGKHFTSGALIVAEKGKFYSPGDYSEMEGQTGIVTDDKDFQQLHDINLEVDYPRSPGHYEEFAQAIKGSGATMSDFARYAGGLTETVLLGNLAVWARGHKVAWNQKAMQAKATKIDESAPDCAQADIDRMVRHEYRNGFTIHKSQA